LIFCQKKHQKKTDKLDRIMPSKVSRAVVLNLFLVGDTFFKQLFWATHFLVNIHV
jgi:hypothetical protein